MNNITHTVATRPLASQPQCRPERATREDRPVACPVTQAQLLPGTREEHGMLPDDVAAADDGEADLPLSP
ncbi:MAG: hypothetical protein WAM21_15025, partial [Steroidobacteraceae bacterium]